MAMRKFGKAYYSGTEREVWMLQGNAARDAEIQPVNGKDHAKVPVAAQETADGTIFVNVNGWRDRADEVAAIRKMDSIFAIGVLKKREYNGKDYYDLDAAFVAKSGVGLCGGSDVYGSAPAYGGAPNVEFEEMDDDDDGELPF